MKKIAILLASFALSGQASAGLDTAIHFTNLSPYTAIIDFREGDGSCWNDVVTDDRVGEYLQNYFWNYVGAESRIPYLQAFRLATGITDLTSLPLASMAGTFARLAPAMPGAKAASAVFTGETSAALFEGCKFATATRGFSITLEAPDGVRLSHWRYVLEDPATGQWRLNRMRQNASAITEATIALGDAGTPIPGRMLNDDATAFPLIALGTASVAPLLQRADVLASTDEDAALKTVTAGVFPTTGKHGAVEPRLQRMYTYVMEGGKRPSGPNNGIGDALYVRGGEAPVADVTLYLAQFDGIVQMYQRDSESRPVPLPAGTRLDAEEVGIDFSSPSLLANPALSSRTDLCAYRTSGVVPHECRLAGLSLSILPDGSLVFMPLPAAGGEYVPAGH